MIYLDEQATTPLAPEAKAAMLPWLDRPGNPHSPHRAGREAGAAVAAARVRIGAALGPGDGQVLFTSGATEALNWAIKGSFARAAAQGRRGIVTTAIEHAATLDTIAALRRDGAEVTILPVDGDGLVDPARAAEAIDARTALAAMMLVNNEIGVELGAAIAAASAKARAVGAVMIGDAAQAFGKLPVALAAFDLLALSAHKMHGPKGIGALWVREGHLPAPLLHGGGQEGGARSGTLSPMLCAGFGAAAQVATERMDADRAHVDRLGALARDWARRGGWQVNGSLAARWPGNLNVRRDGLDAGRLISEVREVAFSAGSACASGSGRPSHVLKAIGLSDAAARSSIRLGYGRYTEEDELMRALDLIATAAERQRAFA